MDDAQDNSKFDQYCIIELFGHNRIAGRVTEQTIGGQSFVRVDVPETKKRAAFTRFFGNGAIYSITPVSEEIALLAAEQLWAEPVTVYIAPQNRQLPSSNDDADEDDDWESNDRETDDWPEDDDA